MKKVMLLTLLAKKGAGAEKIRVTIRNLAEELNTSPQSVLRLLEELEKEGLVEKDVVGRKTHVYLTEKGLKFLESICDSISDAIYSGLILGEVVSGIGEGAYYVRQYAPLIREYLGFEPYPGTLNLKVIFPRVVFDALCGVRPIILPGFVKDGRTFGDVKAYRVFIDGIEGAIVIPSRTIHPPKISEIVAPVNLREKLGLKDGSRIRVRVVRE